MSRDRFLPILLLLFAASGCSALIYEVVWFQVLQLSLGGTSVSAGVLLAAFMGGLCIGSLLLPRIKTSMHPLRVYAFLEFGIGLFGLTVLPLIGMLEANGLPTMTLRGFVSGLCMLPPTILMGASLPAIARWIEGSAEGVAWWGWLYGSNTTGAIFGCLFAGFYLLRFYNMATAAHVAAAINILGGLAAYLLASSAPGLPEPAASEATPSGEGEQAEAPAPESTSSNWPVYLTIALSGATALGAEVVWTRLMGYLLLATVYAIAIILAVFLTGLAIGSAAGSWILKKIRPQVALGWSQFFIVLGIAWTVYAINHSIPNWADDKLTTIDPWRLFMVDLERSMYGILPATLAWGASFPLACAAVASREKDSAQVAGGVYAANTLGSIAGALLVSLWLIPTIGTQQTQRILLVVSALSGLVALLPMIRRMRSTALSVGVIVALLGSGLLARTVDPVPGDLIAYGRRMAQNAGQSTMLYVGEGRNSSVAISRFNNGTIYVNVNGHVEATTEIYDMKLQRMVGHLPAILHPNPKSVLGIGFGAGVSAGSFTRYPSIEHITVCEIEPLIPPASTEFFGDYNYRVKLNPKTRVVYDDARHFLLSTDEKFDIIASDPLDVFVKGTASIYTKEYFESVKRHLNPGGYFTLYVPLYETDEPTFRSELATFFAAFPNAAVFNNLRDGLGYDTVFLASMEPLKIDLEAVVKKLSREDFEPVRRSLLDIGVTSALDLYGTYGGGNEDLGVWTRGAELNLDGDLKLMYLSGWGINSYQEDYLYRRMLKYRKNPERVFTGSPEVLAGLHDMFTRESSGN